MPTNAPVGSSNGFFLTVRCPKGRAVGSEMSSNVIRPRRYWRGRTRKAANGAGFAGVCARGALGRASGGGEAGEKGVGVGDDVGVGDGDGGFRGHVEVDEAGGGVEEAGGGEHAMRAMSRRRARSRGGGSLLGALRRRGGLWRPADGSRGADAGGRRTTAASGD